MKLIITEKQSVAKDIAFAISLTAEKHETYYKTKEYLITWCSGHLLYLPNPDVYDQKYSNWSMDDLPILPTLRPAPILGKKKLLDNIVKLIYRSDVDLLICATDAGREGELIFRLVYEYSKSKTPVLRLWISSMETKSILEGLKRMKPLEEYDNLYAAAKCRQQSDWLVGMNLTRLYSLKYHHRLNVGRVQSPTLNMIVQREMDNENFVPEIYFAIEASVSRVTIISDKIKQYSEAQQIINTCKGHKALCSDVVSKCVNNNPLRLYNLTQLQKDANKLFGYTAKQTLDVVQNLYENKFVTYPRTSSQFITSDQKESTFELVKYMLDNSVPQDLRNEYDINSVNIDNVINDKKVNDHHAILPEKGLTLERINSLPIIDKNIALLITYRLLESVYSTAVFEETKVTFAMGNTDFFVSGKRLIKKGHLLVYQALMNEFGKKASVTNDRSLPLFEKGKAYTVDSMKLVEKNTSPPKLFTEGDLLDAMTHISNSLDDTYKTAMKNKELGTVATRDSIIEKLIENGYLYRDGKVLKSTDKGRQLVLLLDERIKSAQLTAEWEMKLEDIASGEFSADRFMADIKSFIKDFVYTLKSVVSNQEGKMLFEDGNAIGICPVCGNTVYETAKAYSCSKGNENSCGFVIWKKIAGKEISEANARKLLANGKTSLIKGFYSAKKDVHFEAYLVLDSDHKVAFSFKKKKRR